MEGVEGAPGLDLPALESVEVANAYGISAARIPGADGLGEALPNAISASEPRLLEVEVAPGMALE
jgi:benzoylformate decarboxylase